MCPSEAQIARAAFLACEIATRVSHLRSIEGLLGGPFIATRARQAPLLLILGLLRRFPFPKPLQHCRLQANRAMLTGKQLGCSKMPTGPKGQKRPADVNARAVMIAKIATGEIEDVTTEDGKNVAAVALGRMGGKARAESLSGRKRKEIAKKAAKARWGG